MVTGRPARGGSWWVCTHATQGPATHPRRSPTPLAREVRQAEAPQATCTKICRWQGPPGAARPSTRRAEGNGCAWELMDGKPEVPQGCCPLGPLGMNLDKATRRRAAGGSFPTGSRWKESARVFMGSDALAKVCGRWATAAVGAPLHSPHPVVASPQTVPREDGTPGPGTYAAPLSSTAPTGAAAPGSGPGKDATSKRHTFGALKTRETQPVNANPGPGSYAAAEDPTRSGKGGRFALVGRAEFAKVYIGPSAPTGSCPQPRAATVHAALAVRPCVTPAERTTRAPAQCRSRRQAPRTWHTSPW